MVIPIRNTVTFYATAPVNQSVPARLSVSGMQAVAEIHGFLEGAIKVRRTVVGQLSLTLAANSAMI